MSSDLDRRLTALHAGTIDDVLVRQSRRALVRRTADADAVDRLVRDCARARAPPLHPLPDMANCTPLSLGDARLDATAVLLRDSSGRLTEICGEASAGKTQLTLQLLVEAGGGVAVCTEGRFPASRLGQMARARCPDAAMADRVGRNTHVVEAGDLETLELTLSRRLPVLLRRLAATGHAAPVVIVDSLTAVVRGEFDDVAQRARVLWRLAAGLKRVGTDFGVAVVLVNQVSETFRMDGALGGGRSGSGFGASRTTAALGLAWSSCIDVRLQLSRTGRQVASDVLADLGVDDGDDSDGDGGGERKRARTMLAVRRLDVCLSPHAPPGHCHFVVSRRGITALESDR